MIKYPQVGMRIKILEGPWMGLLGKIVAINGDRRKVIRVKSPDVFVAVDFRDREEMEELPKEYA